jgi:hypothetical protein
VYVSDLAEDLARRAERAGVALEQLHRLHLLEGVVRRWAGSRHAGDLVLGGSLLTRLWVGLERRTAQDLDFVALYPHDLGSTLARFRAVLAAHAEDGASYDAEALRGEVTWEETAFRGVRVLFPGLLLGRQDEVRIDVGFGYPLSPPAWRIDYDCLVGPSVAVQALRPEWMAAWKLNGLFFRGRSRWLPKGLFDLYLLTRYVALDADLLREGIRDAFAATAIPLERIVTVVYNRSWWEKVGTRNKWERFLAGCPYPVPEGLLEVAAQVARGLRPALEGLLPLPGERAWPGGG